MARCDDRPPQTPAQLWRAALACLLLGTFVLVSNPGRASGTGDGFGQCPSGSGWVSVPGSSGTFLTVVQGVSVFSLDGTLAQFSSPLANVAGFSVKGGSQTRNTATYNPAVATGSLLSPVNEGGVISSISNVCIQLGTVVTTTTTVAPTTTTTDPATTTTTVTPTTTTAPPPTTTTAPPPTTTTVPPTTTTAPPATTTTTDPATTTTTVPPTTTTAPPTTTTTVPPTTTTAPATTTTTAPPPTTTTVPPTTTTGPPTTTTTTTIEVLGTVVEDPPELRRATVAPAEAELPRTGSSVSTLIGFLLLAAAAFLAHRARTLSAGWT